MNNEDINQKITYLQMIQAAIDRMSTTSAIFKGFCATIIAGISAISFTEISKWVLLLAVSPVICFLIIDVYYLQLEKRFRALYNRVRSGEHEVDFDLTPLKTSTLRCEEKCCVWNCIKSPSIYLFYGPSIVILVIVLVLKFKGVI